MTTHERIVPAPDAAQAAVRGLDTSLAEIGERLAELVRVSRDRERVIDRLHSENQNLRAGELHQALTPLLRDLMRLYDRLEAAVESRKSRHEPLEIVREWEDLRDTLADILYNQGVDLFEPRKGEAFNPREHRGVEPVTVSDAALDRTVARCLRAGFSRDSRILRPADVEVCRFTPQTKFQITNGEENG